jgi:hypothetical protein
MKITFWGTRGSIPSPGPDTILYGGNTTCLELTTASGRTVIIDAGTGIRSLGDALSRLNSPLTAHLLMTHIHWDHVWGRLFVPVFQPNTRIVVGGSLEAWKDSDGCSAGTTSMALGRSGLRTSRRKLNRARRLQGATCPWTGPWWSLSLFSTLQGGMGFKFTRILGTLFF